MPTDESCCANHDPAECIPAVGDAPGVCCSNCPEDTMRARLIAVLEAKPLFGVAEIVDTALRVLAGHPGDLPVRMATALTREHYRRAHERIEASPEEHSAAFAAVAMSVRWEDHAATVAENAELRRRAEAAEGELSALRDHHTRWEAEKARADKAEADVQQLRYERRLLGTARMALDLVAAGDPSRWEQARRDAEDIAQRIVDEIGHPATDEPGLGPELRTEVERLQAELAEVREELGQLRLDDEVEQRATALSPADLEEDPY